MFFCLHSFRSHISLVITPIGISRVDYNQTVAHYLIGINHILLTSITLATKTSNVFNKPIVNFRRIATRYERLAVTYGAMICLAASMIWLSN